MASLAVYFMGELKMFRAVKIAKIECNTHITLNYDQRRRLNYHWHSKELNLDFDMEIAERGFCHKFNFQLSIYKRTHTHTHV